MNLAVDCCCVGDKRFEIIIIVLIFGPGSLHRQVMNGVAPPR